ncbi:MAG: hypothetical protein ABFD83_04430 [Armatimonadota bacterium]
MRKSILLGMLLVFVLSSCAYADKITYDPSLVKHTAATTKSADERLDQKITYTSTNKRLHTILEELSKETGVVIRSGKNANDWQVRDLPLFVCVKDMPLGTLLDHISNVTHLLLSSTTVDGVPQYRMWLDAARRKEIEQYLAKRTEQAVAKEKWTWDEWVRLGQMPESELSKSVERHTSEPDGYTYPSEAEVDSAVKFAKLMAQLPAQTKDKVFAGEPLIIKTKDAPAAFSEQLKAMYHSQWEYQQREQERAALDDPEYADYLAKRKVKEPNLEDLSLAIELSGDKYPNLSAKVEGNLSQSFYMPMYGIHMFWHKAFNTIPEELRYPEEPLSDCPKGFSELSYDEESEAKGDKFKIEKPSGNKEPTIADMWALVSKTSGYSMICEDFVSNKGYYGDEECIFGQEMVLAKMLGLVGYDVNWLIDDSTKVLIGSADEWCDRHVNLMPEKLLKTLQYKLGKDGLDLDDVVPLATFTQDQLNEWVLGSRDFNGLYFGITNDDMALWRLYDSLSSGDKVLAKSEQGVSLAKIDPKLTSEVFAKVAYEKRRQAGGSDLETFGRALMSDPELNVKITDWITKQHPDLTEDSGDNDEEDMMLIISEIKQQFPKLFEPVTIPTDPLQISGLTLRVKRRNTDAFAILGSDEESEQNEVMHSYTMNITGDGVNINVMAPCFSFPVYSEKRQRELTPDTDDQTQSPDTSEQ